MRKINITKIIITHGLSVPVVAEQLFPANKYPRMALTRVIKGDALLNSDQISKLALLANIPISELFNQGHWTAKSKGRTHTFTSGEYRAELNTETNHTRIFHCKSMFHDTVLTSEYIRLKDYLTKLDLEILKFKENDSN